MASTRSLVGFLTGNRLVALSSLTNSLVHPAACTSCRKSSNCCLNPPAALCVAKGRLLRPYKDGDANVRSVWLCSRNDAIGNVVVMVAAFGVWSTSTAWPDLAVAALMAGIFLTSALQILRQARSEYNEGSRLIWLLLSRNFPNIEAVECVGDRTLFIGGGSVRNEPSLPNKSAQAAQVGRCATHFRYSSAFY